MKSVLWDHRYLYRSDPQKAIEAMTEVVEPAFTYFKHPESGLPYSAMPCYSAVFAAICERPEGMTAHQVADVTGYPLASVWPILHDLHRHLCLLTVSRKVRRAATNRFCSVYRLNRTTKGAFHATPKRKVEEGRKPQHQEADRGGVPAEAGGRHLAR